VKIKLSAIANINKDKGKEKDDLED